MSSEDIKAGDADFIEIVRAFPILYNKQDKGYFDNRKKAAVYGEIAVKTGLAGISI